MWVRAGFRWYLSAVITAWSPPGARGQFRSVGARRKEAEKDLRQKRPFELGCEGWIGVCERQKWRSAPREPLYVWGPEVGKL